jgi:hypothetical protein
VSDPDGLGFNRLRSPEAVARGELHQRRLPARGFSVGRKQRDGDRLGPDNDVITESVGDKFDPALRIGG